MQEAWQEQQESWDAYLARIKTIFDVVAETGKPHGEQAAPVAVAAQGDGPAAQDEGQALGAGAAGAETEPGGARLAQMTPVKAGERPRCILADKWERMERLAARQQVPDLELDAGQQVLFYAMAGIYGMYRAGKLPLAAAKQEKLRAIAWHEQTKEEYLSGLHTAEFFKGVEAAARGYALEPSLETADGLYWACYKMLPKKRMKQEETA